LNARESRQPRERLGSQLRRREVALLHRTIELVREVDLILGIRLLYARAERKGSYAICRSGSRRDPPAPRYKDRIQRPRHGARVLRSRRPAGERGRNGGGGRGRPAALGVTGRTSAEAV